MELVNAVNTFVHDALIGGTEIPLLTKVVSLIRGSGTVVRGTVLGKITKGAVSKGAKTGGNTGNGTLTLDTTTPLLAGAKVGVYKFRVVRAAIAQLGTTPPVVAQAAVATLADPDGNVLETFELPATPGIEIANDVKFVVLEGNTAFVVDDGFDITVAAGSGLYKIVNSASVDGSNVAECVLAYTVVVPSGAEAKAEVFTQGMFNSDKLVFGGSDTYAAYVDRLRDLNFFLTNEQ